MVESQTQKIRCIFFTCVCQLSILRDVTFIWNTHRDQGISKGPQERENSREERQEAVVIRFNMNTGKGRVKWFGEWKGRAEEGTLTINGLSLISTDQYIFQSSLEKFLVAVHNIDIYHWTECREQETVECVFLNGASVLKPLPSKLREHFKRWARNILRATECI